YEAPPRSRRAPSVDHVVPLHLGGTPLPPVDELRLVHVGCNARRGNRTRALARNPNRIVPVVVSAVEVRDDPEPAPLRRSRRRTTNNVLSPTTSPAPRRSSDLEAATNL